MVAAIDRCMLSWAVAGRMEGSAHRLFYEYALILILCYLLYLLKGSVL